MTIWRIWKEKTWIDSLLEAYNKILDLKTILPSLNPNVRHVNLKKARPRGWRAKEGSYGRSMEGEGMGAVVGGEGGVGHLGTPTGPKSRSVNFITRLVCFLSLLFNILSYYYEIHLSLLNESVPTFSGSIRSTRILQAHQFHPNCGPRRCFKSILPSLKGKIE